jgi:putative ABC transport system permease protein
MKIPLVVGFTGQAITAQLGGDNDTVSQLLDIQGGNRGDITLGAAVNEIPGTIIAPLFDSYRVNVLIPQSVYEALYAKYEKDFQPLTETMYTVSSPDPDAFCKTAEELLTPLGKFGVSGGITIQNVAQMTRFNQNITLLVMLFGYGFIAMLSLIAVTSVIATISTGMALRRQEFAMLYSVGMTPEGMNKMLNLESLLYGSKSLLIGLPVGVGLSYLIYLGMSATFQFDYELPFTAMIISIAAVMLLTFGTMRYSKRKLREISIVEAIRNEAL